MRIPISDKQESWLDVETTSISQLDQAYVASLREQLQQARICILEAQMYLSIGATERAQATLSQGLTS